ncbi:V-type proton ATPase subunit C-like protein [Tanacetum coccineum]
MSTTIAIKSVTASNTFIEVCSHKITRQIEDLEKVSGILGSSFTVDGVPVDSYLTKFVCDEAKYSTMSPLKEIVDGIHVELLMRPDVLDLIIDCARLQAWPVGPRLLAIKFLETCVMLFMLDNDSKGHIAEAGGHPILDSIALHSKASRSFMILLTLLRFFSIHLGSISIFIVNRKITDDMKAKNHKDRARFVSSGEKEARKSALSAAKVGPPKLELVMGRKGDFFCAGKVNNINVDKCTKMGVLFKLLLIRALCKAYEFGDVRWTAKGAIYPKKMVSQPDYDTQWQKTAGFGCGHAVITKNEPITLSMIVNTKIRKDILRCRSCKREAVRSTVTAVSGSTESTKLKFDNIRDLIIEEDIFRDYDDALVCCVENMVEDRIIDSGALFHATFCKEELEKFSLHSSKVRLADEKTLEGEC